MCLKYLRYALWFCRAKYYICCLPICIPFIGFCILQCISKPVLSILKCTLTTQTEFQNRLLSISFRHLKSETNYGTRNHYFTVLFQFLLLVFKDKFCIPKAPYILHFKNTALYSCIHLTLQI